MKKLLCFLGLHFWRRGVFMPVRNDREILCREYDQCRWCGVYSWVKHFRKFNLKEDL